jgi:hypothetical protein
MLSANLMAPTGSSRSGIEMKILLRQPGMQKNLNLKVKYRERADRQLRL